MRNQREFIQVAINTADNELLSTDFPINTLTINNTTDSTFDIYFGEVSLGMGTHQFDYQVSPYTFATIPVTGNTQKITISWNGSTKQFDPIRVDMLEEKQPLFLQTNPPATGGQGVAQNVSIQGQLPPGNNTIGKVLLGTSDEDLALNGTMITGETLSTGGSNILGWLSEIAHRIKTTLSVSLASALPAGGNNIGKVDINSMPTQAQVGSQAMTATPITKQITLAANTVTPLQVGTTDLANRKQLLITNMDSTNTVYIGGSAVSNTNGYPLGIGAAIGFDQNPNNTATLYAFSTVALTVGIMEVN